MTFPGTLKVEFSNTDMDSITHALHRIADSMTDENRLADAFADHFDNFQHDLRDEIAIAVIQSLTSQPDQTGMNPSFIANHAYQIADIALKVREKKAAQ